MPRRAPKKPAVIPEAHCACCRKPTIQYKYHNGICVTKIEELRCNCQEQDYCYWTTRCIDHCKCGVCLRMPRNAI